MSRRLSCCKQLYVSYNRSYVHFSQKLVMICNISCNQKGPIDW